MELLTNIIREINHLDRRSRRFAASSLSSTSGSAHHRPVAFFIRQHQRLNHQRTPSGSTRLASHQLFNDTSHLKDFNSHGDHTLNTSPRIVNPSPRTIYLVRHGETQGNIDDKAQGHLDVPLTETRPKLQAKAVSRTPQRHRIRRRLLQRPQKSVTPPKRSLLIVQNSRINSIRASRIPFWRLRRPRRGSECRREYRSRSCTNAGRT